MSEHVVIGEPVAPCHDDIPVDAQIPVETPRDDVQGEEQAEQDVSTDPQAEVKQGEGLLRSGVSAREAALARWRKVRERETDENAQAAHEHAGHAVVVRVSVQVGDIIRALAKDAAKGNTQSARELRAYLADFPVETDTDVSALDRRTRQTLLALLMDERVVEACHDGRLQAWLDCQDNEEAGSATDV